LILKGNETTVEIIQLTDEQTAEIPVSLGDEYDEAILVVTGTTRFTRELANYSIEIEFPRVEEPQEEVKLPPLPELSDGLSYDEKSGLLINANGVPSYYLNEEKAAWFPIIPDVAMQLSLTNEYKWALIGTDGQAKYSWDFESHSWVEILQEQAIDEEPEISEEPEVIKIENCPKASPPRLEIGGQAEVLSDLNFRSSPEISNNNLLMTLSPGTRLKVLEETVCTEYEYGAYLWWYLESDDGIFGWAAEAPATETKYFLEPVE